MASACAAKVKPLADDLRLPRPELDRLDLLTAGPIKTTYFGDAMLHGRVDGSDYTRIDSGYLTNANGWSNGDFNYDGVINGSDYTLIDNAFNSQGASLAAQVEAPLATKPDAAEFAERSICM